MQPKQHHDTATRGKRFRRTLMGGAMAVTLVTLSGCSSVPDSLNPAEWYNSTVDFFSGEDEQGQVANSYQGVSQKNPGEGKEFPKLAAIPPRPANTSNQGLVADVEGRKYAQSIARQGESAPVAVAKAAPPAPAAPMQPAPPAMPAVKVTQAQAPAPEPVMKAPQPAPHTATVPGGQPANTMSPLDADPYATVVVSSNGIEVNGSTVTMPERETLAQQTAMASGASTPALQRFKTPASGAKIATILFDNGSDNLDTHDRKILGEVVRLQKQRGGMVRVIGHSSSRTRDMDAVRHAMVNYKLSTDLRILRAARQSQHDCRCAGSSGYAF